MTLKRLLQILNELPKSAANDQVVLLNDTAFDCYAVKRVGNRVILSTCRFDEYTPEQYAKDLLQDREDWEDDVDDDTCEVCGESYDNCTC